MSWTITPSFYGYITDADAKDYLARVHAAEGQTLEPAVALAIEAFVVGCKADGIWNAIKASCILAGARTLAGALVPLVGTAPTNFNFVAADYNRETGLVGDGSTKYLDSNRNNNADPRNSKHLAAYVNQAPSQDSFLLSSGGGAIAGNSSLTRTSGTYRGRVNVDAGDTILNSFVLTAPAFVAIARSASSAQNIRVNNQVATSTVASVTPNNLAIHVFGAADPSEYRANARLAFYSIGESLDLALLGARVTALINAIGAAIP